MEDDTGKVQLSAALRESARAFGELQGEFTNQVRQLDLIQTEVKQITESRDAVVGERERLEHQVVQYQNEIQRLNQINVVVENGNRAIVFDQVNKQRDFDALKDEELKLKEIVSQLDTSVRELSQKAGAPDPDTNSVVAKLNSEVFKAQAENASQQDVFSRKIDEVARANAEKILRYTTQIGALHGEALRLQSRSENKSEARSNQNEIPHNPKKEVSVASSARSMSPGTTSAIYSTVEQIDQRISGLSDRVDRSDDRASSSRPSEEPARGRSTTT